MFKNWKTPKNAPCYDGTGIWYRCNTCDATHEINQSADFRGMICDLCRALDASSQAIYAEFDIGKPDGRWSVDHAAATFTFILADGRKCTADYGTVASWNQETSSWFWSWAMPDGWLSPAERRVGETAYDHGYDNQWEPVTRDLLLVDAHEAWHLTKLAAHLSDMPMVYRIPVNDVNHHYLALSKPVWQH